MTGAQGRPRVLDLRGLRCPLPALKTRKALMALEPGGRLVVVTDDPFARLDIPNVVREGGGELVEEAHQDGAVRFMIRRGGRA